MTHQQAIRVHGCDGVARANVAIHGRLWWLWLWRERIGLLVSPVTQSTQESEQVERAHKPV